MIIGNDFDNINTDFFKKKYAFYFCKKKVYIIIHMTKKYCIFEVCTHIFKESLTTSFLFLSLFKQTQVYSGLLPCTWVATSFSFFLFSSFMVVHFGPLTFFSFNSILSCYVNIVLNLILALYAVCITLILCFAKFVGFINLKPLK
jgi:hypothetical protein